MDFTARIFSIETGWPPPELFVTVSITKGIFFAPSRSMVSASRAVSMFPLKGCTRAGSFASAMGRSSACAPTNSQFARVVSKCVLFGTTSPFLHITLNKMRSEEHTSELQSHHDLVCRLLLEKKKKKTT